MAMGVLAVHIQENTVLLHHEHLAAEAQQLIELYRGKFLKMLEGPLIHS
jgi:hypothetical protein